MTGNDDIRVLEAIQRFVMFASGKECHAEQMPSIRMAWVVREDLAIDDPRLIQVSGLLKA